MCVFFRCCCFRFVFVFDLSLFCWILFLYSLRIFESYKREFTKWLTAWFRFPDFSTTVLDSTRKNLHFHTSIYDKLIIFFFCPNFICFCFFFGQLCLYQSICSADQNADAFTLSSRLQSGHTLWFRSLFFTRICCFAMQFLTEFAYEYLDLFEN